MPKLIAFSGSCRDASLNARLVSAAAAVARDLGATVTEVSLRDYDMPLYNGDLEEDSGIPEPVRRFRSLMAEHDGMIVGCPEYNGSITPLLKNTIDWCSRPDGETPALVAFRDKTAALVAASPGGLGGIRGLAHVRAILSGIFVHVVPAQFALGQAHTAFGDNGALSDEGRAQMLEGVIRQLVDTTRALNAS